jgi:pSer/pThr/pTyr-binding forkhead associated (FHA) protein
MRKHHKDEDDVSLKVSDDEQAFQTSTSSEGAGKWKCLACGAFNDDSDQVCSECTAMRAGSEAAPKESEAPASNTIDWETPSRDEAPSQTSEEASVESDFSAEPQVEEPQVEPEEQVSPPVISPPIEAPSTPSSAPSFTPSFSSAEPTGETHYYLLFVNSPAPSIIKTKVSIDFENFPTISIGRNPENVVVIPDQEVSRKHAELSMQGDKIFIRDLNSKNGTFVYNGKSFERVSDSVEVKPNSLLKFGTGTIVRLTTG